MARNTQPIIKNCRRLDISPAVMGYVYASKKDSIRNPKAHVRRKESEYSLQLKEKQKVKFIYGILERQFRLYYEKAAKAPGITGENLLNAIERRLDNVVFRLGFAMSRAEARQLVSHGHFTVNGRKVNIPSYQVKPGMVIAIKESSRSIERFKANLEANAYHVIPKWLDFDANNMVGKVVAVPAREDIDLPVEEHLIVELYSK